MVRLRGRSTALLTCLLLNAPSANRVLYGNASAIFYLDVGPLPVLLPKSALVVGGVLTTNWKSGGFASAPPFRLVTPAASSTLIVVLLCLMRGRQEPRAAVTTVSHC